MGLLLCVLLSFLVLILLNLSVWPEFSYLSFLEMRAPHFFPFLCFILLKSIFSARQVSKRWNKNFWLVREKEILLVRTFQVSVPFEQSYSIRNFLFWKSIFSARQISVLFECHSTLRTNSNFQYNCHSNFRTILSLNFQDKFQLSVKLASFQ